LTIRPRELLDVLHTQNFEVQVPKGDFDILSRNGFHGLKIVFSFIGSEGMI
jgi:hypothetical protein